MVWLPSRLSVRSKKRSCRLRTVSYTHLVLFGWVPTRDEGGDPSSYLWGGTFMPLEIVQRADGTLGTKLPDSMLGAFGEAKAVEAFELSCESGKVEQVLAADAGSPVPVVPGQQHGPRASVVL